LVGDAASRPDQRGAEGEPVTSSTDPVARYVLDGSDADLRRLLTISQATADITRLALRTAPVAAGWHALECGCGPLGTLAILAELVGPSGRVVGVDANPDAVARARGVLAELKLDGVEVLEGDVNDADLRLPGPFDLAVTRCFLMHQADLEQTLRRIAAHLRPGGWLVAMEPIAAPAPFAAPDVPALTAAWQLIEQAIERSGGAAAGITGLPAAAARAGFEIHQLGGLFQPIAAALGLGLHAATTQAARERIVASGVASAAEVDDVVAALQSAPTDSMSFVTSPLYLTLTLRRPAAGPL
jgi:SAM-dependent methyltransferase